MALYYKTFVSIAIRYGPCVTMVSYNLQAPTRESYLQPDFGSLWILRYSRV